MKLSLAELETDLRSLAGSATRPLLSTEYVKRPLKDDIYVLVKKCEPLTTTSLIPHFSPLRLKFNEYRLNVKRKVLKLVEFRGVSALNWGGQPLSAIFHRTPETTELDGNHTSTTKGL